MGYFLLMTVAVDDKLEKNPFIMFGNVFLINIDKVGYKRVLSY